VNVNKSPYIQQTANTRSFSMYPGQGPGGAPYGGQMFESQWPAMIPQQQPVPVQPGGGGGGLGGMLGNLGGGLGNFNFKDFKSVLDRMGGIEGVMSAVGKVQKIMSTVKQMQPMIKLLMGSFAKTASNDGDVPVKRKRRRRRTKRGRSPARPASQPLNKVATKKKSPSR
jgi:hypothetical protein